MTKMQEKGLVLAMMTALISGVSNFANGLVVKGIDPLVHNFVKNGLVALMVIGVMLIWKKWPELKRLTKKDWGSLGLIALVGGSVPFWLFFTGVKQIGGVEGSLIHKTLVVWVILMAVPLLKEKVSKKMLVGVGLLFLSNFALPISFSQKLMAGHGLVLLATLLWSVENVVAKKVLAHLESDVLVLARMGGGGLVLGGMLLASGKVWQLMSLTGTQWAMLFGVAVLLFGYVMTWYRALKLAPVTQVASILVGATVITSLLQTVFVTKAISMGQVGQAVMIVAGLWFVLMAAMDMRSVMTRPALEG